MTYITKKSLKHYSTELYITKLRLRGESPKYETIGKTIMMNIQSVFGKYLESSSK